MDNNGQRPSAVRPVQVSVRIKGGQCQGFRPAASVAFFLLKRNVILKVIVCLIDFCPIAAKDLIFKRQLVRTIRML